MSSTKTHFVRSATSYLCTIGGHTFQQPRQDGLQVLVFEDHVDMVDMLTVRVGGAEEQPEWGFEIGQSASLQLGSGTQMFEGEITAVEPGFQVEGISTMTVRCLDRMHRLGRGRKTRFWEDVKDSDVAAEVGAECGLAVDAEDTGEVLPYIIQRNESNVAFLKRLAARNNYQLRVQDGKLLFKSASFGGSPVKIEMGKSLRSVRMSFNSMDMVQKVVVRGWDIMTKEEIVGQASTGDVTPMGDGQLGAEIAGQFGDATAYITDVPVATQSQANQIAKAEMERLARQFCHGTCTVVGNDQIRAGTMVEFSGLPNGLNGKFYVMATRHVISNRSGYTTELTFCSNTMGS